MKMEYYEIGEVFEFGGKWLKVVPRSICCMCFFFDKYCNRLACQKSVRADKTSVVFVEITEPLTKGDHFEEAREKVGTFINADYIRLKAQVAVLKEVQKDYSGKTIDNIVQQLEATVREIKN